MNNTVFITNTFKLLIFPYMLGWAFLKICVTEYRCAGGYCYYFACSRFHLGQSHYVRVKNT